MNEQIVQLQKDLQALRAEFSNNNFTSSQVFTKSSSFTDRLKVPHFSSLPSTCQVGEIGESSGKLYICSASNTWVVAGGQS